MTSDDVRALLLKICRDTPGGQAAWAQNNGISAAYVSDVINGRRDPAESICEALGLERHTVYQKVTSS